MEYGFNAVCAFVYSRPPVTQEALQIQATEGVVYRTISRHC